MIPMNDVAPPLLHSPGALADAFSEFISASSLLEASYRDLQQEVAHLGVELAERNAALTRSLEENDRMRAALQQIIDSMPCGVLVSDDAESIVMINPEGRRMLELGSPELGSPDVRNLRDLSAKSQIDFESLAGKSVNRLDNDDRLDTELSIASDGGRRWLAIGNRRLRCLPAVGEAGDRRAPLQSVWILRDVTANKQAEREREAARNTMALAEMSTILAHEIRNPLTSMELMAELIETEPARTSEWVSHLRAGIRSLSATVNNVLSIHSGGNPHLAPINLTACARGGVEFVMPIAKQASVMLRFMRGNDDLVIQSNENMLRQMILNLICNAIRHTPAGGAIDVSTRRTTRQGCVSALLEIKDTGCGIPANVLDRIFDAGFSASGDTPGLGLAVCKRLMEQHHGEIRVSSRENCGTTFQLEFPPAVLQSMHRETQEAERLFP
jgi:signal transduction histidine kinase